VDGQYDQQVAIKLLPESAATAENKQRFLMERQILAGLDHPNICRLLDGGFTPDGLPYFVMELVTGVQVDEYCNQQALGIAQRLRLFQQTCSAVHYAHQKLVLHRDIKPGNILVDEAGRVRLLDFGISKIVGADTVTTANTTRLPMTPLYASPEMLAGDGATTSSDVYSLGVLLFRLLTGLHPKNIDGSRPLEDLRALAEQDPKAASVRVVEAATDTAFAEIRVTINPTLSPDQLSRRLSGDLDNILAKALSTDSHRRYGSVQALNDDINRYLRQEPVTARPTSVGYVTGRFLKRNPVPAVLAALALGLLVTLAFTATRSAITAREQAKLIASERDRAQSVSNFLMEMLNQTHPQSLDGETLSVRELIDRASDQLNTGLEDQPATRAELLKTAARVQQYVGAYERSQALLEQEMAIRKEIEGEESAAVASVLERMTGNSDSLGRMQESMQWSTQALRIRESIGDVLGAAHSHRRLGRAFHRQGQYEQAQFHFDAALSGYAAELGEYHSDTLQIRSHLAWLAMHQGNLELSIARHRQVLSARIELQGEDHIAIAETQLGLGQALAASGDQQGALRAYKVALAVNNRVLGESHRDN